MYKVTPSHAEKHINKLEKRPILFENDEQDR